MYTGRKINMKNTNMFIEHRRVWTIEKGDFDASGVALRKDCYCLSDMAARRALLKDVLFCSDVAYYGFPQRFFVNESDTPDVFDVEVIWEEQY